MNEHFLKNQKRDLEKMKGELVQPSMSNEQIQLRLIKSANQLLNSYPLADSAIDDYVIIGRWKNLQWSIKDWAVKASYERRQYSNFSDAVKDLAEDPVAYCRSRNDRHLLMQAYLWHVVRRYIFNSFNQSDFGLYWAGGNYRTLHGLRTMLQPDLSAVDPALEGYHTWRATVSRHISQDRVFREEPRFENLMEIVVKEIGEVSVITKDEVHTLKGILWDAVELDKILNTQKAFYYAETWFPGEGQYGFRLENSKMEILDGQGDGGMLVRLVVSPALYKAGSSASSLYKKSIVLAKGKVTCKDPEKPGFWKTLFNFLA